MVEVMHRKVWPDGMFGTLQLALMSKAEVGDRVVFHIKDEPSEVWEVQKVLSDTWEREDGSWQAMEVEAIIIGKVPRV